MKAVFFVVFIAVCLGAWHRVLEEKKEREK